MLLSNTTPFEQLIELADDAGAPERARVDALLARLETIDKDLAESLDDAVNARLCASSERWFRLGWDAARDPETFIFAKD